ncbi:MAG: MFS transporter [Myxococcales bacterium]|nr:MFS transporter [Myxococcales bacterium]
MRPVSLLALLYVAQGLPFGFQATALPVWMREHGATLSQISLAGVIALPWMLKPLWAPLVDRWGSRRRWIAACQAALALFAFLGAAVVDAGGLAAVLTLVAVLNLCAATQDIAVDGLAIDLLPPERLGWGNAAQVVGYKVGMLTGGGVLVWLSGDFGWSGTFAAMGALFAAVLLVTSLIPVGRPVTAAAQPEHLADVFQALLRALTVPGAAVTIGLTATYKLGEAAIDAMMKPFLVDAGFQAAQIGLWMGTWGMAASLGGSALGGWLASAHGTGRAVILCAWLRLPALVGEVWLAAVGHPGAHAVIGVTLAEHVGGGALTTAMFAWMMGRVDRRIGASHFTALAAIEVIGKAPAGWLSGPVCEALGYPITFAAGTALSVAFAVAATRWALDVRYSRS